MIKDELDTTNYRILNTLYKGYICIHIYNRYINHPWWVYSRLYYKNIKNHIYVFNSRVKE
jgi:hypothetical protein